MEEKIKHILVLLENHVALSDVEDEIVLNYIKSLQNRIDKAFELLQLLHYNFPDYDDIHARIEDIQKILKESGE